MRKHYFQRQNNITFTTTICVCVCMQFSPKSAFMCSMHRSVYYWLLCDMKFGAPKKENLFLNIFIHIVERRYTMRCQRIITKTNKYLPIISSCHTVLLYSYRMEDVFHIRFFDRSVSFVCTSHTLYCARLYLAIHF